MPSPKTDNSSSASEWNETVLNYVDKVVETASTKIVHPAHKLAKFFVYTILALALLVIVIIAFSISSFRVLNLAMPVWASYMLLGGVLILIGSILWAKK